MPGLSEVRQEVRRVRMHAHDRLFVEAVLLDDGPGDDPLALMVGQAPVIVGVGESRWLREHDVPFPLRTW